MADRAGGKGALMYDPGADAARRFPDWVIRHRPLHGVPEVLCPRRRVILIDSATSWPAKRCSLAHAVAHLDLGHQATAQHGALSRWMEREANGLAARRLIPVQALADVLCWTRNAFEVAEELGVDVATLEVRRRHLHPSERSYIEQRMTWLEETA